LTTTLAREPFGTVPSLRYERLLEKAPVILASLSLAAWLLTIGHLHPYDVGALGLLSNLTVLWWSALVLDLLACVLALLKGRTAGRFAAVVVLAVVLDGTLPGSEPVARFFPSYQIAGFSNAILHSGRTFPLLDARMSWPGLFAGTALASATSGLPVTWFLRWSPLVLNLLYLLPLKSLASRFLHTLQARWFALIIFLAGDWLDQDYFSPQGVTLFLYLVAADIMFRGLTKLRDEDRKNKYAARLVTWTKKTTAARLVERAARRLRYPVGLEAQPGPQDLNPGRLGGRVACAGFLLLLGGATVVTHQLTPIILVLILAGLTVLRRCSTPTLTLFFVVAIVAWVCWIAEPFWSYHIRAIFGGVGGVGGTVDRSVAPRLGGSTLSRTIVERSRIGASGLTVAGGAFGLARMRWRSVSIVEMVLLAVAPVVLIAGTSYGGEVPIRILLFALAPLAIAMASFVELRQTKLSIGVGVALCLLLISLFPLTRYGNESFEAIPPGDYRAATWLLQHAANGSRIITTSGDQPLEMDRLENTHRLSEGAIAFLPPKELRRYLLRVFSGQTWIYLSRSEEEWGTVYQGLPSHWMSTFEANLSRSGAVERMFSDSSAEVFLVKR
jgi:hypothetical protein